MHVDIHLTRCLIVAWRQKVRELWGWAGSAGPMTEQSHPVRWNEWCSVATELLGNSSMSLSQATDHIGAILEECYRKGDLLPPPPSFFLTERSWRIRLHQENESEQAIKIARVTQRAKHERDNRITDYMLTALHQSCRLGQKLLKLWPMAQDLSGHSAWSYLLLDPGVGKTSLLQAAKSQVLVPEFVACSLSFSKLKDVDFQSYLALGFVWRDQQKFQANVISDKAVLSLARELFGDELIV